MTYEQIEKALKQADDLPINEEVDCYDVLCFIQKLNKKIELLENDCSIKGQMVNVLSGSLKEFLRNEIDKELQKMKLN